MQEIHLIVGVPGSGKTWVINQLDKDPTLEECYLPVPHDNHSVEEYHKVLIDCAKRGEWPVIAECPFRASVLVEQLEKAGCIVNIYYLIEDLDETIARYELRDRKAYPKMHITNFFKYSQRSPRYTQIELLKALKKALLSQSTPT